MSEIAAFIAERLRARNLVSRPFFAAESEALARTSRAMAERFLRGGRLLACGRAHSATDAQHVAVEFVHPVIVGKRALPAVDLSPDFRRWLPAVLRRDDVVMGFGPPGGDPAVAPVLAAAHERGAQVVALPGTLAGTAVAADGGGDGERGDYAVARVSDHPYVHQELIEILYHTLWETVHVFLEHRERGHQVGSSSFLYPFLGSERQDTRAIVAEVAASIRAKAADVEALRERVGTEQTEALAGAVAAMRACVARGGKLLTLGNGGSATDANDLALDCAVPLRGFAPIPALSLAMEPATLTALANDVGVETVFLRQLIAHAQAGDLVVAFSTSGGSANVLAALVEAKQRGLASIALLGYDGGETLRRGLADHPLVVPSDYIPRIQEVHASMYHVMLEAWERLAG